MKTLLIFTSLLACSSASASPLSTMPAGFNRAKFVTECRAELNGSEGPATIKAKSQVYEIDLASGKSNVKIALGDYTIFAEISRMQSDSIKQADGSLVFTPTMEMQLYRDGNPVQGSVTYVRSQGWEFETWQLGRSQNLSSFNFLVVNLNGQTFSRLDYACSVARVQ